MSRSSDLAKLPWLSPTPPEPRKPWLANQSALTDDLIAKYGDAGHALHEGTGSDDPDLELFDNLVREAARVTRKPADQVASELYQYLINAPPAISPPDVKEETRQRRVLEHYDHQAEKRRRAAIRANKEHEQKILATARESVELKVVRSRIPPSFKVTSVRCAVRQLEEKHERQAYVLNRATDGQKQSRSSTPPPAPSDEADDEPPLGPYNAKVGQSLAALLRERRRLARRVQRAQLERELIESLMASSSGADAAAMRAAVADAASAGRASSVRRAPHLTPRRASTPEAHSGAAASQTPRAHGAGAAVTASRAATPRGAMQEMLHVAAPSTARSSSTKHTSPPHYRQRPSARAAWGLQPHARAEVRV